MKSRSLRNSMLGLAVLLAGASGCVKQTVPPPNATAYHELSLEYVEQPTPETDAGAPTSPETGLANADAVPVAGPALPANIRPSGPAADVIKLANSGVDQGVLLAYVTNSPDVFDLNADEIIYLHDLGVPKTVVSAILQHDQALKQARAPSAPPAEAAATTNPQPPVSEPGVAPEPDFIAPLGSAPASPPAYLAPTPPPLAFAPRAAPAAAVAEPPPAVADVPDAAFYDGLAPYGTWMDVEGYGNCWRPSVVVINPSWQPYFDGGHWVYTDCGWYWASDYSWGWAPFHYGRWFRHHRWGWCWAPDRVWAPSWVCWRYTDGYCGWAPLPPGARYQTGLGLTFRGRRAEVSCSFDLGVDSFFFVSWGRFHERHLREHALPHDRLDRVFHQSVAATRFVGSSRTLSNYGISRDHVAAATHTDIRAATIRETAANTAGRAEHLSLDGRTLQVSRRPTPEALRASNLSPRRLQPDAFASGNATYSASPALPTRPLRGFTANPPDRAETPSALNASRSAADQRRLLPSRTQPSSQDLRSAAAEEGSPNRSAATPRTTAPQTPSFQRDSSRSAYPAADRSDAFRSGAAASREFRSSAFTAPNPEPRSSASLPERSRVDFTPASAPQHTAPAPAPAPQHSAPAPAPSSSSGSSHQDQRGK